MLKHRFPPKKVLVPTDLGPASAVAMGYARILHQTFTTEVEVLHSLHLEMPPYFSSSQIQSLKREIARSSRSAEALLRKESATLVGFDANLSIVDESVVDAILQRSESTGTGLVIMGTHGRHGAQRVMLGSVAERVIRQSRVPVLAVRESSHPVKFGHILCPFNFSDIGRAALNFAVEIAAIADTLLTVIHAREEGDGSPPCSLVEEQFRGKCRVQEMLVAGDAAKNILEAAHKVKPDLIVMGAARKPTVIGELFSSTTERVMQRAEAPLLVVPRV